MYFGGAKNADELAVRRAFRDGVPLDASGQPDFGAMSKTLFQKGDLAGKRIVSQAVRGPRVMTWVYIESEPVGLTDWYRLALLGFPPLNVWGDTLVVHRDRGDLGRVSGRGTATVYVAGVSLRAQMGQVNVPQDVRNDEGSSAVAKWWEGMSLAVVRYREEARFTREVTADPFVLSAGRKP